MTERKVTVKVRPDGSVEADFAGFVGDACLDEAERLAEMLARFGLEVSPVQAHKKTPAEIERETGAAERAGTRDGDRVPTRK